MSATSQWSVRLVLASLLVLGALAAAAEAPAYEELTGWLTVVWGDGPPDGGLPGSVAIAVHHEAGATRIEFSEEFLAMTGGLKAVNGRQVKVWLEPDDGRAEAPRRAAALRVLDADRAVNAVTGSQPWVSILCKFADVSATPQPLSFFQGMYDNSVGRLDHYWRETSYTTIDIVGSTAVDWRVLPRNQNGYTPVPGSGCGGDNGTDLGLLFDECTAVADPFVDFSAGGTGGFAGINQMFNEELDGCAWGGGWYTTLDGVTKLWRVTWEPPWGYENVSVMAHEMGHGFGLPHSNNADGDGDPYDNTWDVMSDAWYNAVDDATYGTRGKHTISYHKNDLGWIPANRRLDVSSDGQWTVTIDDLALATTSNYRMAKIAIPGGSRFYTVEVRDRTGAYDGNLPGNAVIIHEVDESRGEPAWLIDPVDPGNSGDEGAMWRVGETFDDVANDISVEVISATTDGFQVTISRGEVTTIFLDGFEGGTTGTWSLAIP